jgi:hypothetical protein
MSKRCCVSLVILALLGCARTREVGGDAAWELWPFGSRDVSVVQVEVVGPYLLVSLHGRRIHLSFFAPATPVCGRVLAPEARLTYTKHGVFGRFSREGEMCDPVGTASLASWRDRQPRARGRPAPRGTARYKVIYADEKVVLLRGEFPLANRIGITGGFDLVAMLPNSEDCRAPIERGEASIEFRDTGREPFRLVGRNAHCPVLGFANPVATVEPGA